MRTLVFILICVITNLRAQTLTFSLGTSSGHYSITCAYPQVSITASSNYSGTVNYTWVNSSNSVLSTANNMTTSSIGNYSVTASSSTLSSTQSLSVFVNTVVPVSTGACTFQVASTATAAQIFTFSAISPTVNYTHVVYSPFGGTVTASGSPFMYIAGGPGIYVHAIIDDVNGCASCPPYDFTAWAPGTFDALEEKNLEEDQVFPNPSNGLITLRLKQGTQNKIEIYNSIGSLLLIHDLEKDGATLDLRQQPKGIYLIKIYSTVEQTRYLKIIRD